jgi:predicted nucleic acid-binding protein
MEDAILIRAARLEPASLRTLDAIHLATTLSLATDVAGLVTYDAKLAEAAAREGFDVLAPS